MVPSGNLANASSVGAKTVNDESSLVRASTNSADIAASTRLVKIPASMAISAIVLASGNVHELVLDDVVLSSWKKASSPHQSSSSSSSLGGVG